MSSADPIYRNRRHRRVVLHQDILEVNDALVVELLRDLTLYEYVPSLDPIRRELVLVQASLAKMKATKRSGYWDAYRKLLAPLIRQFHILLQPGDDARLKEYLKVRKQLDVGILIFAESPY